MSENPLLIVGGVILFLLYIALGGCGIDRYTMTRLLSAEGVVNWTDEGYRFLECGHGESLEEGFRGVKNGQPVRGLICATPLGGYVVRYK